MSKKIRVGNLPPHVTVSDLKDRFSRYGLVSFVVFIKDEPGCATIEMADPDSATKAIARLNFSCFEGQVISVSAL